MKVQMLCYRIFEYILQKASLYITARTDLSSVNFSASLRLLMQGYHNINSFSNRKTFYFLL